MALTVPAARRRQERYEVTHMRPLCRCHGVTRCRFAQRRPGVDSSGRGSVAEGFTLLELLIAIAVILILVATTVPNIMRMQDSAHGTAILAQLRVLSNELSVYRMDCGGYPEGLDGLNSSPEEGCAKGNTTASDPATVPGYRLSYRPANPDGSGAYTTFTLAAGPLGTASSSGRFYFMDQTGIVRMHSGAPASVSDPAIIR